MSCSKKVKVWPELARTTSDENCSLGLSWVTMEECSRRPLHTDEERCQNTENRARPWKLGSSNWKVECAGGLRTACLSRSSAGTPGLTRETLWGVLHLCCVLISTCCWWPSFEGVCIHNSHQIQVTTYIQHAWFPPSTEMSPGTPDSPHYLTNYTFHRRAKKIWSYRGNKKKKEDVHTVQSASFDSFAPILPSGAKVPPVNASCWPVVASCVQGITDKLPLARCRCQLWGPGTSSDVAHHAVLPGHMPSVCQATGRRGAQTQHHHTLQKGHSYSVSFEPSHIIRPAGFGHQEACLPAPSAG